MAAYELLKADAERRKRRSTSSPSQGQSPETISPISDSPANLSPKSMASPFTTSSATPASAVATAAGTSSSQPLAQKR